MVRRSGLGPARKDAHYAPLTLSPTRLGQLRHADLLRLVRARDLSDDLTGQMPIVPHRAIPGVDCWGCIVAAVEGNSVELRCNECGAVLGVVQADILRALLGLESAEATCPHLRQTEHLSRLQQDDGIRL
jgi:hypothetical protein